MMNPYKVLRHAKNSQLRPQLQRTYDLALNRGDDLAAEMISACLSALQAGDAPEALARRIRRDRPIRKRIREPLSDEQAVTELADVQQSRKIANERCNPPGSNKLDRYHQEILALHKNGASERDIEAWLRRKKNLSVHQSTVHRFLVKNKESNG